MDQQTPRELGYYFPPEWAEHEATWLSWPHKEESWPGKLNSIYPVYCEFVKILTESELVRINAGSETMISNAKRQLENIGLNLEKVEFFLHPTNDAWCRDHGPAFLVNPSLKQPKMIVDWDFNAWGGKYPPYNLDDIIPTRIAQHFELPVVAPGIIMEGGSVEFNGKGTILTSSCCLLNKNRNPHLKQRQIEQYLFDYYGMEQVLWVDEGIVGDDTDGHIDDTIRFINEDTVLSVFEASKRDENYDLLQRNLKKLSKMRLLNDKQLNIIELPMPKAVVYEGTRLPASYANFYISNGHVIVPTYQCKQDDQALEIIQSCFPTRKVMELNSTDIIWGLGSFHCLSQQEPKG